MAGISSPGVGSGLDIKSIVDALVKAETTPAKARIDKQESSYVTELSALGQIKSSLTKLQTSMKKLGDLSQFYTLKSSISDTNALQANVSRDAFTGQYDVEVLQLATQHNLYSKAYATTNTVVGQGTITIDFGTYSNDLSTFTVNPDKTSAVINISASQNSLIGIRDAINNANQGVMANIVQDSQGARLTLTTNDSGQASAMRISVVDNDGTNTNDTGLSALAYNPPGTVNSMTQSVQAKDSQVKINGLTLSQKSNTLENAIAGVSLDLKQAESGTIIKLKIENNKAQLSSLVHEFVKEYNDSMTTLNNLTKYEPETKKAGPLQGDFTTRTLKFNLSQSLSQPIDDPSNSIQTLRDIGIKTNSNGLLEINEQELTQAMDGHYNDIGRYFSKTGLASDVNVKVKSIGADIKAGTYQVNLSNFTPGSSLEGTIGGIIATSADGYTLKGSGALKNINLSFTGGGTGDRGNITVYEGLASKIDNFLSDFLDPKGSFIDRNERLNQRITALDGDRDKLSIRAADIERRYLKQFTALDGLLSQMQSTSEFLNQQLSNLSRITINKG